MQFVDLSAQQKRIRGNIEAAIQRVLDHAQYTILAQDRDALSKNLQEKGVPSVAYYARPLHLQGAFADLGYKEGDFPVSEYVAAHCLSLPMSPYLTQEDQKAVAAAMA